VVIGVGNAGISQYSQSGSYARDQPGGLETTKTLRQYILVRAIRHA
jgi:hypothetical protein